MRLRSVPGLHGVDAAVIQESFNYVVQKWGLSSKGAAHFIANLIWESQLDPLAVGDQGTALGLAQWRFERQEGLPLDGPVDRMRLAQIDFAFMEMKRDGQAAYLPELLQDASASDEQLRQGLRDWERWGVEGDRFMLARELCQAIGLQ